MHETQPINVEDIHSLLSENALAISDETLCRLYDNLHVGPGAAGPAQRYLACLGYICAFRPHLAEHLLRYPVWRLIWLGAKTPEDVFRFVRTRLAEPDFRKWTRAEGWRWLQEDLPKLEELVERVLKEQRHGILEDH